MLVAVPASLPRLGSQKGNNAQSYSLDLSQRQDVFVNCFWTILKTALLIWESRAFLTGQWERRAEKQLEKHCHKTLGSKSFIGYPQVAVACEPIFRLITPHAILVWWPTTSALGGSSQKGKHHDWPKTWKGSEVFTLMQCNDRWGVLLVNCKN